MKKDKQKLKKFKRIIFVIIGIGISTYLFIKIIKPITVDNSQINQSSIPISSKTIYNQFISKNDKSIINDKSAQIPNTKKIESIELKIHSNPKELIKSTFNKIIKSKEVNEATIAKYFHPDYKQFVDGKQLDYLGLVQHIKSQKTYIKSISTTFKSIVSEGNTVFTNHLIDLEKNDGTKVKIHVIAEFRIKDNKIVSCDELTHMLQGNEEDRDLGSRTK